MSLEIGLVVQEDTFGRCSVSTCPSNLLIVGFHGTRYFGVDNTSDVLFVDSHPKGVGCQDPWHVISHKCVLDTTAIRSREISVVAQMRNITTLQMLAELLKRTNQRKIDDSATFACISRWICNRRWFADKRSLNLLDNGGQFFVASPHFIDDKLKIWPADPIMKDATLR